MLSFITTYLASRSQPEYQLQQQPAWLAPWFSAGSGGGSSGGLALRTSARLWEVQWPELTVLRRIGRGSFGSVYLAEWQRTAVALKVLVRQGERGWVMCLTAVELPIKDDSPGRIWWAS